MFAGVDQNSKMKKHVDREWPGTESECRPSRALIDELAALESMLAQHEFLVELEDEARRKANEEGE